MVAGKTPRREEEGWNKERRKKTGARWEEESKRKEEEVEESGDGGEKMEMKLLKKGSMLRGPLLGRKEQMEDRVKGS